MNNQVQIRKFKKVLVANRGEIAIRVFRALNELEITTVSIYSKEDRYALFRSKADESYPLNPEKGPIDAYLDIDTIIKIALAANVDAIHPGYGFLSENPDFVDACERNGIVFIGPSSQIMNAMGDKISSKKMAIDAQVPIIPGVDYAIKDIDTATKIAAEVGFPIMLKASNGGGGRGMRIVNAMEDLEKEFNEAKNESKKAFGDDKIFIEKYLRAPKHIEVQILGDNYGNVVHLLTVTVPYRDVIRKSLSMHRHFPFRKKPVKQFLTLPSAFPKQLATATPVHWNFWLMQTTIHILSK